MDDIEVLIETLHTFLARLDRLRNLEGPEFLLPAKVEQYHNTLEDAYAAYGKVETAVDALGQELEHQHVRLDKAVKQYGA
jgi:hypothetical protein